ncbi:MAG: energy-coupling factor ABC transporter permease [Thermoplasmata archaeon]
MHIPDGLMLPLLLGIGWVIAIIALAVAVKKTKQLLPEDKIPTMAVLAAGIFVAQMLNFPIAGGTSGHLIGATIATVLVGPWAAILVMSIVIIIQGLMFGDGGILSLGLNLTNMAVIGVLVSAAVLGTVGRTRLRSEIPVFSAAWLAVFVAALACALELAVSSAISGGTYGIIWTISLPAMLISHAMIGIGEAAISVAVISYLSHVAPAMLHNFAPKEEVAAQ